MELQEFIFNADEFISLVEKHPSLWNTKTAEFHDKDKRHYALIEIAKALFEDFDFIGEKDKEERVKLLRSKWKNIKDSYSRELRMLRNGSRRDRPYTYINKLKFLRDPNDEEFLALKENDPKDLEFWWRSRKRKRPQENSTVETLCEKTLPVDKKSKTDGSYSQLHDENNQTTEIDSKASPFEDELLTILTNNVKREKDSDYLFLKSLHGDFERVPSQNLMKVKMELLQILEKAQK